MSLHEELSNVNPDIIAIAAELTVNPEMPVSAQDSVRAIEPYPGLQKMIGVLKQRYIQVAESSGMDEDYARTLLVGSLAAINTIARCAEIQMLEESVDATE
jgi:hypothetical protein